MEYILATNFINLDFSFNDENSSYTRLGNWVNSNLSSGNSYEDKFRTHSELNFIDQETQSIYAEILKTLTEELNKYDEREFTYEEGMILYGPWLYHMISHYCYLYRLLKYVKKHNRDAILVCGDTNYEAVFEDTLDHKKNIRYDVYNNHIIKKIASYIGLNLLVDGNHLHSEVSLKYENHEGKLARKIVSKIENIINFRAKFFLKNSYINKTDRIKIYIKSKGSISTITNRPEKLKVKLNTHSRISLSFNIKLDKASDFSKLISENIINEIPICYLEGFEQLTSQVNKNYKSWKPELILSANGWYHDEPFKLWAIKQKKNGAKLIGYQHGGVYFTYKNNFYLRHETLVTDYFFSWGNANEDYKNIIPFFMQKKTLVNSRSIKKINNQIMLLTNNYSKQHHLLEIFQPTYSSHIEQNCNFLKELNSSYDVKYRPFRADYGWNEIEEYKNIFPSLKFSSYKQDALEEMKGSKVVVFDNIHSTSFLESIVMNIPSIILAKDFKYEINKNSLAVFKRMQEHNILFDSGKECAKFLNLNYNSIDEWWDSNAVQEIINDFRRDYAPTCSNFSELFIKEVSKIHTR